MKPKQWFLDRIGKRIYRDEETCKCSSCQEFTKEGIIILNDEHAYYLYLVQNDYANENIFLNYRDEK